MDPPSESGQRCGSLFSKPKAEAKVVLAPQLFSDVVRRQWAIPGAGANPSSLDRRYFNLPLDLDQALQVPAVDGPIVSLVTSSVMTDVPEEAFQPEDRHTEQALKKVHQSAVWAVKASPVASFFNRASLLWLRQLQDKVLVADVCLHQDLNKLSAPLEFSVDATLGTVRFASKAIASFVASRRLLWLRQWQVDAK